MNEEPPPKTNGNIDEIVANEEKTDIETNRKDENCKRLIRNRACSERSDSGISDCSSHLTINNSTASIPLLNAKYLINEEVEESKPSTNSNSKIVEDLTDNNKASSSTVVVPKVKLNDTIEPFHKVVPTKCEYIFWHSIFACVFLVLAFYIMIWTQ